MGYNNYGFGGVGNNVGGIGNYACGYPYGGSHRDSFALIVVLFILLIIVGAAFYC
ncbi:YjcZ family sporulation protein [Virgibacillus sediminis]|uniref:YjcZ family sporulation protein n=1 Tax=Virgibacillus sediminis TaxID=202260 RepID=A0ABV7ABQ5_9BACI